jgi:hypothetical protein
LIAEYEKSAKSKSRNKSEKKKKLPESKPPKKEAQHLISEPVDEYSDSEIIGEKNDEKNIEQNNSKIFEYNNEPERIIGATDADGELKFLIKWKNLYEPDLVPAKIANKIFPELVIKFYEERMCWDFDDIIKPVNVQDSRNPFEQGFVPNSIIGATSLNGHLMFLIDWKDEEECDLVFSKIAKVKCPELVIQFYQDQLILEDTGLDNENL